MWQDDDIFDQSKYWDVIFSVANNSKSKGIFSTMDEDVLGPEVTIIS